MSIESKIGVPTWMAVKEMYEAYPYPSPIVGDSVIDDVANCLYSIYGDRSLEGMHILDAGCGTGHRLVGAAKRYPLSRFVGIDMTEASLDIAKRLALKHGATNIRFERRNLLDLDLSEKFDIVISTGVIHHLEDPVRGLQNLASRISPDGILVVWLYNSVGEHDRLMSRELLHLMWDSSSGMQIGVEMMRDLGLTLEVKRYGSTAAQKRDEVSDLNIDVDAYVHPIVNAYTFAETLSMLRQCRELEWAAFNNINLLDNSKLIDIAEVDDSEMAYFCQSVDRIFERESIRNRFRSLNVVDKLRVMELKLRPTGFTVVAGRLNSYSAFGKRLTGNTLKLHE